MEILASFNNPGKPPPATAYRDAYIVVGVLLLFLGWVRIVWLSALLGCLGAVFIHFQLWKQGTGDNAAIAFFFETPIVACVGAILGALAAKVGRQLLPPRQPQTTNQEDANILNQANKPPE